jgi:hypothetical protein
MGIDADSLATALSKMTLTRKATFQRDRRYIQLLLLEQNLGLLNTLANQILMWRYSLFQPDRKLESSGRSDNRSGQSDCPINKGEFSDIIVHRSASGYSSLLKSYSLNTALHRCQRSLDEGNIMVSTIGDCRIAATFSPCGSEIPVKPLKVNQSRSAALIAITRCSSFLNLKGETQYF